MRRQRLRDADTRRSGRHLVAGGSEEQLGPFFDQVGCRSGADPSFPGIFIKPATPAEGESAARYLEAVDTAIHLAGLASEPAHQLHLRRGERQELGRSIHGSTRALVRQECDAERTEQLRTRWDDHRSTNDVREGVPQGTRRRPRAWPDRLARLWSLSRLHCG